MSRSEYITLAARNKSVDRKWVHMKSKQTTPTGVAISFANIANPALAQRTRNDNVQGEVMNSRPLDKKKSYGRRDNGKSSLDDYTRKKSFTPRKIGIMSSRDCRMAPYKQFVCFDTPKRIKKRMVFRRRCANALNLNSSSICDTHCKSKIVRNAPKRKKKARRALSQKPPKPTSTQELNHFSGPNYHISYQSALDVYKSMRKGNSFLPSR